jgi:rhodanese-related sulfurtransferase
MRSFRVLLAGVCLLAAAAGAARTAPAGGTVPAPAALAKADTLAVERMRIPEAMAAAARGEIQLVDVRPAGQRALGHVRGDASMPFDRLVAAKGILPKDRKLVFYCSCPAEELALDAARVVIAAGNARVAVLVGGYDDWHAAGGATQVDETWEEVFRLDDPPTGWGKVPVDSTRCRYTLDESNAGKGRASACVTCRPDTTARGFSGYVQRIDPTGLLGRTVTLSALVRSADNTRGAFLWIGAEDAQGRFMRITRPEEDPIVGTQDWRASQVTGVVPPDAARVLIGISLTAGGRLWLDDVRLVALETGALLRMRAVVSNPGFEE